jgi:ribose/xylose/arabinose/galactoside ABC-type transport system permease subunit
VKHLKRLLATHENMLILSLAVFMIAMFIKESRYLHPDNISEILYTASILGIIAVAQMVVILTGGIDISVGAILAISATVIGGTIQAGVHPAIGIGLGLASGVGLGAINGSMVSHLKIPPIIVTLATLNIFRGGIDLFMKGKSIDPPDEQLAFLTIPSVQIMIFFITAAAVAVFLATTRTGRLIYAIGDNPDAAEVSGVNLARVRMLVYVICGFLAAIAGLMFATRAANINRMAGMNFEFIAIGAVVLGGTNLFGGSGKVRGTVFGVIFIYAIYNAMVITRIPATWQDAVTGLLIIIVVSLSMVRRRTPHEST